MMNDIPLCLSTTPPAFVETSSNDGAEFNVHFGTSTGSYSTILEGVAAGQRDPSIVGLQTYGDARGLGRYIMIEGITGSGGGFSISEVGAEGRGEASDWAASRTPRC